MTPCRACPPACRRRPRPPACSSPHRRSSAPPPPRPPNIAGHDRVPRPRPQRRQRRLHQPAGAHRPRRHQGLPGQRHLDRRRLSRAHLHLGDHAAHPPGARPRSACAPRCRAATTPALGPCVDERAAMANALQPGRGRAASTPTAARRPAAASTSTTRPRRSTTCRPGRRCSSPGSCGTSCRPRAWCRPPTSAPGGLNPRSDIAGLNLAQFPSILVELGNMKNPADSRADRDARRPAEVRRRRGAGHRRLPGHARRR